MGGGSESGPAPGGTEPTDDDGGKAVVTFTNRSAYDVNVYKTINPSNGGTATLTVKAKTSARESLAESVERTGDAFYFEYLIDIGGTAIPYFAPDNSKFYYVAKDKANEVIIDDLTSGPKDAAYLLVENKTTSSVQILGGASNTLQPYGQATFNIDSGKGGVFKFGGDDYGGQKSFTATTGVKSISLPTVALALGYVCTVTVDETKAEFVGFAPIVPGSVSGQAQYTVRHLLENKDCTDGSETYSVDSARTFYGNAGGTTRATANRYEGFTAQDFSQSPIHEDGSTTVDIRYKRNQITVTFDANGGHFSDNKTTYQVSGKYGNAIGAVKEPTWAEHVFNGWTPSNYQTFPSANQTYKAVWKNTLGITVTLPTESDIGKIECTKNGEIITFAAPNEYAKYTWKIDDVVQSGGNTFTYNTANAAAGLHYVMVVATDKNGEAWSATIHVEITK